MSKPIIISIAIEKGGVAKTTTALNLGAAFRKLGKSVLLVDLDQQGNLSDYLGFDFSAVPTISELIYSEVARQPIAISSVIRTNVEGIDYIPSSRMLSTAITIIAADSNNQTTILRRIFNLPDFAKYNYIIIDCRSSLDLLVVNALVASDKVIIPVQAEKFAIDGLAGILKSMDDVRRTQNPALELGGMLLTLVDKRTTMSKEVEELLRTRYADKVFRTVIPRMSEASKSTADQRSLVQTKNSKLGAKYLEVAEEVING